MVCMASTLSLYGHISAHFDDIHLELSVHAYFKVCFHFMLSKYEHCRNSVYDVITIELYCTSFT